MKAIPLDTTCITHLKNWITNDVLPLHGQKTFIKIKNKNWEEYKEILLNRIDICIVLTVLNGHPP